MKKYRIKEEVKKYLTIRKQELDAEMTEERWDNIGISKEALEEVEERVEVSISCTKLSLRKATHNEWKQQEREDIEKFLNVFGSWENLKRWGEIEVKEKGYDK